MEKKRYYLHGDLKEAHSGLFYCASCDVFLGKAHFNTCLGDKNAARLRSGMKHWLKFIQPGSHWQRPDDAINLFSWQKQ